MDALAGKRVEVCRLHAHQRLSLAGLHLRDAPGIEHERAHNLHGVGFFSEHPECSLAGKRKCFRKNIVESLAVCQTVFECLCLPGKIFVLECLCPAFLCYDLGYERLQRLYVAVILRAEEKR